MHGKQPDAEEISDFQPSIGLAQVMDAGQAWLCCSRRRRLATRGSEYAGQSDRRSPCGFVRREVAGRADGCSATVSLGLLPCLADPTGINGARLAVARLTPASRGQVGDSQSTVGLQGFPDERRANAARRACSVVRLMGFMRDPAKGADQFAHPVPILPDRPPALQLGQALVAQNCFGTGNGAFPHAGKCDRPPQEFGQWSGAQADSLG